MPCKSETVGHRAKLTEFVTEVAIEHIRDTFELVVFNVILGSTGELAIF